MFRFLFNDTLCGLVDLRNIGLFNDGQFDTAPNELTLKDEIMLLIGGTKEGTIEGHLRIPVEVYYIYKTLRNTTI